MFLCVQYIPFFLFVLQIVSFSLLNNIRDKRHYTQPSIEAKGKKHNVVVGDDKVEHQVKDSNTVKTRALFSHTQNRNKNDPAVEKKKQTETMVRARTLFLPFFLLSCISLNSFA